MSGPTLEKIDKGDRLALCAAGAWTATSAPALEKLVADAEKLARTRANISIDVSDVSKLDTFGAWLIERLRRALAEGGQDIRIAGLSENYASLVDEVRKVKPQPARGRGPSGIVVALDGIGRNVYGIGQTLVSLVDMIGAVIAAWFRVWLHPSRFRLTSMVHHMQQVCWNAVPIIVLITFLIGCIVAQQGIFHFRRFGADIYVVDMVGVLVLRELGVLIVSIMIAGRSGSAYTAELGSMRMREEVDALRVMGLDPVEILIVPRVLALMIGLPMLTLIGDLAALAGGGLTAMLYGGLTLDQFLVRLQAAVGVHHVMVGLIKAPFMALTIGVIATIEGFAVEGSAESLGRHVTASVVKSIFMVIVLDGLFAVFFAAIDF